MDRDALRALQAPLKEQYKTEPEAAHITLKATGTLGEGVSCSVDTGRAIANAGLHPATGGDGSLLCSGDMLLEALVACAGVTLGAVSTSLNIPINEGKVHAEGDLDFRGTLGVDKAAPVGFSDIRLRFELDTDADDEQLATLLKLTERYCVVLQTLARGPQLDVKLERARRDRLETTRARTRAGPRERSVRNRSVEDERFRRGVERRVPVLIAGWRWHVARQLRGRGRHGLNGVHADRGRRQHGLNGFTRPYAAACLDRAGCRPCCG